MLFNSPTKGTGVFSNVQSKVSGWLPTMPTMSMPAMPNVALPNVGLPNIPGLKKNSTSGDTESAVEAAENASGAAGGGGDDDEDRSRYIRYVGLAK